MEKVQVTGFGNPLLDISANVNSKFLEKYGVEPGGFLFETEAQAGIYEDLKNQPGVELIPGGATLNSLRVAEALSGRTGVTYYCGCVGEDHHGTKLESLCGDENVSVDMAYSQKKSSTGVCGVMVLEKERSLCTRLGAANDFPYSHLEQDHVWGRMQRGLVSYCAGYVLTVCPEGMCKLANHCLSSNKIYATNLSAPFLVEFFKEPLAKVFELADCMMGNEQEWKKFGEVFGCAATDLESIARFAVDMPWAGCGKRAWPSRWVVITQGHEETIVARRWPGVGVKLEHYPVEPCSDEELVDTNAAGDAFAGGFVFGLVKVHAELFRGHVALDVPVAFGHYAARHIIQRSGCQMDFQDDDSRRPRV